MVWNLESINNYKDKIKFPLKLHLKICCQCDSSINLGFPNSSDDKESACNVGDLGLITGSGRCPGEGNVYPLQYSCLENSMDRGTWQATDSKELDMTERTNPLSINLAFIEGLLYATWYQHLASGQPSISVSLICKMWFDCKMYILTTIP